LGQNRTDELFEDTKFRTDSSSCFFQSEKVDFMRIPSSVSENVEFAVVIYKPSKPSPVLLLSHGWHQSVMPPNETMENPYPEFLTVQVDMRGRKYSTGQPDCNGLELYDFYDASLYVAGHYEKYISDISQVYYLGGSGGGGNGFAIIGKFPDLFCSAMIACGISDYAEWYRQDKVGEFRDDMDIWIGYGPEVNEEGYRSRSGITTASNVLTPVYIVHGETDIRVPVIHSRKFVSKGNALGKKINYLELENVGTRDHWGRITPGQNKQKKALEEKALQYHPVPELPIQGKLIVAGYVVTKYFEVFMDSIDSVGKIEYDLTNRKITFTEGGGKIIWKQ
jgi:pimeloyl-ACP methyl ester carboxylesterase